jgi:hypothetical protein
VELRAKSCDSRANDTSDAVGLNHHDVLPVRAERIAGRHVVHIRVERH